MVRLTKIYTRTGDGGRTRLVGGQQVDKTDGRIEAYGTVDELNAVFGGIRAELAAEPRIPADAAARLDRFLLKTQQTLFNLGSDLATRLEDRWEGQPLVQASDVTDLERLIDAENSSLEDLKSFVLPGGSRLNAALHLGRTVCRRAERRVLSLAAQEPIGDQVVPYLNRLSDALFVLSRRASQLAGVGEVLWDAV